MITWRTVFSSNLAAVGWPSKGDQPAPPLLLVMFKDGKVYGYLGGSRQRAVYMAYFCPSPGAYLNKKVKPRYDAVRIPELDKIGPPF